MNIRNHPLEKLRETAIRAARAAGDKQLDYYSRHLHVDALHKHDLMLVVDRLCEQAILDRTTWQSTFNKQFGTLLDGWKPFPIRTEKTSWSPMEYEGERKFFLYLPVLQDDALMQLNRHLLTYQQYRKSDKTSFHPHVTLLWNTLSAEEQEDLKAYMTRDARVRVGFEWTCDNVSLYGQGQDQWVPFHVYPLQ